MVAAILHLDLTMHLDTAFKTNVLPTEATSSGLARRPARLSGLALTGLFLAATAWQVLSVMMFGGVAYWAASPPGQLHLALNVICMSLVVWHAARTRGSLDHKLGQALFATALTFGVYSLAILGGRLFFSRAMLLSTVLESLVIGLGVVWLRHKLTPTRVAWISPLLGHGAPNLPNTTTITDPSADLRGFDVALVSLHETVSSVWARALSRAMLAGCKVRHVGEYIEELRGAVSLDHFEVDHLSPEGIASYRPLKRALDLGLVFFFMPVALPLLAVASLLIVITDGGPVFFTQERGGLGGAPFRIWKLRTMRPQRPGESLRAAVPGDDRVTPVGRVLRRLRIDELPQIWNVVKGDMSLIGPRPEAMSLHSEYLAELPGYAYRYLVRPGITGWAQVCAPPSANAHEARLKLTYDLYYVKRLSLGLDLQIAIRTFWTLASGGGAR